MVANENTAEKDKETIISIVKEMAESMTGAQSTRHWAADALWFDIPAFASKGIPPALKMFDSVFSNFESCKAEILEMDVMLNGDMGVVCTVEICHSHASFAESLPEFSFEIETVIRRDMDTVLK